MQSGGCRHCFASRNWSCMHCFAPQDSVACRMGVAGVTLQPKIGAACIALHTRMVLNAELGLQALLCIPKLGLHALLCTQGWFACSIGVAGIALHPEIGVTCIALHTRMVCMQNWGSTHCFQSRIGVARTLCNLELGLHALLCTPGWF